MCLHLLIDSSWLVGVYTHILQQATLHAYFIHSFLEYLVYWVLLPASSRLNPCMRSDNAGRHWWKCVTVCQRVCWRDIFTHMLFWLQTDEIIFCNWDMILFNVFFSSFFRWVCMEAGFQKNPVSHSHSQILVVVVKPYLEDDHCTVHSNCNWLLNKSIKTVGDRATVLLKGTSVVQDWPEDSSRFWSSGQMPSSQKLAFPTFRPFTVVAWLWLRQRDVTWHMSRRRI